MLLLEPPRRTHHLNSRLQQRLLPRLYRRLFLNNGSCSSFCYGCSTTAKKPPGPPTVDLSCGNQGVQWAIYPNKKADGANDLYTDSTYSTFEPTRFKTASAEYTGKMKIVAASDVRTF